MNNIDIFHDTVLTQLSALQVGQSTLQIGQTEIGKKLDRMNGSVQTLYDRIAEGEKALLAHAIECPQINIIKEQRDRIDLIDRDLTLGTHPGSVDVRKRIENLEQSSARCDTTRDQNEKQSNKWIDKFVIPLLKLVGTGILLLFFLHANEILNKL
jgi:hypothetical protein